jgi:hypothetical protein
MPPVPTGGEKLDPDLTRTSQQFPALPPLPRLPASLTLPQPPPIGPSPTLLAPNVSNEAEQVARLLTGQPLPPNPIASQANSVVATATTPNAGAGNQGSSIVVMPAPVVVVPAKDVDKKTARKHQMHPGILKKLGNRIGNAMAAGTGN